jgi:hypothetical protein
LQSLARCLQGVSKVSATTLQERCGFYGALKKDLLKNQIIVELKSLMNLEDVHLAQAKNYVVAYDFPIGLLINFGAKSLQFKKIFDTKYNPKILQSGKS